MTPQEIAAKHYWVGTPLRTERELAEDIEARVLAEREACAQVAYTWLFQQEEDVFKSVAHQVRDNIRARAESTIGTQWRKEAPTEPGVYWFSEGNGKQTVTEVFYDGTYWRMRLLSDKEGTPYHINNFAEDGCLWGPRVEPPLSTNGEQTEQEKISLAQNLIIDFTGANSIVRPWKMKYQYACHGWEITPTSMIPLHKRVKVLNCDIRGGRLIKENDTIRIVSEQTPENHGFSSEVIQVADSVA